MHTPHKALSPSNREVAQQKHGGSQKATKLQRSPVLAKGTWPHPIHQRMKQIISISWFYCPETAIQTLLPSQPNTVTTGILTDVENQPLPTPHTLGVTLWLFPCQRSLVEERALTMQVSRHKQAEGKKENRSKSDNEALNQLQDMVKDFAQGFS